MNYIKSRWSNENNDEAQPNHSQSIETSYNSVTFTNARPSPGQNPIIISTQHPSQISIIHEVRNPSLKANEMTSPTDSFHSVVSTFHNDKRDGKVNLAYTGSNMDMNNPPHQPRLQHQPRHQQQNQSQHSQDHVFHQSYWSWSWPWSNWNLREKVFLLVIVILSLCILSLTSVLSVVVQKNVQYRDMLFEQLRNSDV